MENKNNNKENDNCQLPIVNCQFKPADRLAGVSEYYFSRKLKEVAQMNAEGKDVISLGIGSPDMPPSKKTIETLCQAAQDPDGHGYMPYVGIPELRQAFARWYKRWYGVDLDPQTEIQPLIGSKEGILHVTLAFVNPGDQVLVPNPGYPTYTSLSKLLGAEVVPYNLKEEDGWMPDWEQLEAMDTSRVRLMWTNYPNMPTGAQATPERQPVQLHPQRPSAEHPRRARCKGMLHRVQLHEQEPQHAGLAHRDARLERAVRAVGLEGEEQHRQRHVPRHATGRRHRPRRGAGVV